MENEEKKYTYQGKEYSYDELQKLAKTVFENDLKLATIKNRLKRGWSVGDAISMPEGKRRAMFKKVKSTMTSEQRKKVVEEAREYRKKHPEKVLKTSAKQKFNTYLRKYADVDGLKELKSLIHKRREELQH